MDGSVPSFLLIADTATLLLKPLQRISGFPRVSLGLQTAASMAACLADGLLFLGNISEIHSVDFHWLPIRLKMHLSSFNSLVH